MGTQTFLNRMKKELGDLESDPPPLITCYPIEDDITRLEAYLNGPPSTPYEKGIFRLDITMPETYPFDPPMIRFRTPIYHPNIDECGRICASVLKKGKDDQWKPSMNLRTTLLSLHALIGAPNPDDPLDADIAREYQQDYVLFVKKARDHTKQHAIDKPDNLIPDTHSDSTTSTPKSVNMELDSYSNDSDPVLSSKVDDTSGAINSKPKNKIKLSLSKKQSNTQPTALSSSSSQQTVKNDVKSTLAQRSDSTASTHQQTDYEDGVSKSNKGDGGQTQQILTKQQKDLMDEQCDVLDHSRLGIPEFGSRNKTTNHENVPSNDKDDAVEQSRLGNLEEGPGNMDNKHEMESNDDNNDDLEQSNLSGSHDNVASSKDTKYEDRSSYEPHINNQDDQVNDQSGVTKQVVCIDLDEVNDRNDTAKQVVCIDLDDETDDREQLIHNTTTCPEIADRQTPIDMENDQSNISNSADQGSHKDGMDKTCENATNQLQSASLSSPTDKISAATPVTATETVATSVIATKTVATSVIATKTVATSVTGIKTAATATIAAAPVSLSLTPLIDKTPLPTPAIELDNNDHFMDTTPPPSSPLKTVTVNDTPDWIYTNHYSSHHLTSTTNDPLTETFSVLDDDEEKRPITPKRKLKLSLSCKKKPRS